MTARGDLTEGGEHRDPVGIQAPRDEAEDGCALLVEPLRVVDEHQESPFRRHPGEQGQRREADHEEVGRSAVAEPERCSQGAGLRRGQPVDLGEERSEQLMERGETELDLRFDPDEAHDVEITGGGGSVVEQRGLPDARLTS